MKTFSLKAGQIQKAWHVLDAENVPLGRIASRAAILLRGKHKPTYSPHLDMGDFVVIVNAERVRLSSSEEDKKYYSHSGYPGSLRVRTFREMRQRQPGRIIESAVKGMLPHNRLGAKVIRHLKVYAGPQHPHEAQIRAGTGARAAEREKATTLAAKTPAAAGRTARTPRTAAALTPSPATEEVMSVMTADAVTDLDTAGDEQPAATTARTAARPAPAEPEATEAPLDAAVTAADAVTEMPGSDKQPAPAARRRSSRPAAAKKAKETAKKPARPRAAPKARASKTEKESE